MSRAQYRKKFVEVLALVVGISMLLDCCTLPAVEAVPTVVAPVYVGPVEEKKVEKKGEEEEGESVVALSEKQYETTDFSSLKAPDAKVSLIVAVMDYSPRNFPALVSRMANLYEQSLKSTNLKLEIFFTHLGPSSAVQFDIIEGSLQQFNEKIRFVIASTSKAANTKLAAAYNYAASKASGSTLIFTTDTIQDISVDSIIQMARALAHPEVGVVAPKIIDGGSGGSSVFSTGISFVLGKNPHKSSWASWYVQKKRKMERRWRKGIERGMDG